MKLGLENKIYTLCKPVVLPDSEPPRDLQVDGVEDDDGQAVHNRRNVGEYSTEQQQHEVRSTSCTHPTECLTIQY